MLHTYAQLRNLLEPFRKFLSENVKFSWSDELNNTFEQSKKMIIDAIKEGVEIFDLGKKTCLRCDWSKKGIGFYLSQKHCKCSSSAPDCCENGWRITLCGSRFLQKSEENYAPIEGEALAVAWALEQTKFFTLGCKDLIVVVDHRPLTKTLGDRKLDEIENTRLYRLKEKTLRWKFNIFWRPGKTNSFSDAVSRHPVGSNDTEESEINTFISLINTMIGEGEKAEVALFHTKSNLNKVAAVTWEMVQEATYNEYHDLLIHLQQGEEKKLTDDQYNELQGLLKDMYILDDVIMYKSRILIPPSLRDSIVNTLHSAHQGELGMSLLAQTTVYWPGITKDIEQMRKHANHV